MMKYYLCFTGNVQEVH